MYRRWREAVPGFHDLLAGGGDMAALVPTAHNTDGRDDARTAELDRAAVAQDVHIQRERVTYGDYPPGPSNIFFATVVPAANRRRRFRARSRTILCS